MARKFRYFVGDFETTVFPNQTHTEVWASALVELFTDDVKIFHSIQETYDYLRSLKTNLIIYYHNLKFDGSFWLSFLMTELKYMQAVTYKPNKIDPNKKDEHFLKPSKMWNNSFTYSISNMGQWYRIVIKTQNYIIELRDSLKLLPFSVKKIGKDFDTLHKKLDMEYVGYRYAGCTITDDEKRYIANDVLVVKEALEIMQNEGHDKLTIGSCCLAEYERIVGGDYAFKELFPDLTQIALDKDKYGADNVDEYVRMSYRGGWCYLVKGKENKVYHNGTTADVNSLYPSVMSGESGNIYPVGVPVFWQGNYIPADIERENFYYFVRFKTKFYIKDGYLPFIQIKNTFKYKYNEMLTTSDIYNYKDGKYYDKYYDFDGNLVDAYVVLTMTCTDYKLFREHYNVKDFEILDGCYFESQVGIFDDYINKYKKIKTESVGAKRQLAKLFLNSLYGKMASSTNSNYKVAFVKEDNSIGFKMVEANDKKAGYIAVGSAITSYARNFTIRAAQKNFHGADKRGFIYADTDSIHCDLMPDEIVGIKEHPVDFNCWKLECQWDEGLFVRQKTYLEHVTHKDRAPVDKPYYDVKCAGMPETCKRLFIRSVEGDLIDPTKPLSDDDKKLTPDGVEFLTKQRKITDFKNGLVIPEKLLPKRIKGGTILCSTTYEMR